METHGTSRLFRYTRDFGPFVVERARESLDIGENSQPLSAPVWTSGVYSAETGK